jgi:hypothetical protein
MNLTQEQSAARLGCPLRTVRNCLARVRKRLHRRLTRRGTAPVVGIAATTPDGSTAQATATAIARTRLLDPVPSKLADFTVEAAAYVAAGKPLANAVAGLVSTLNQRVL